MVVIVIIILTGAGLSGPFPAHAIYYKTGGTMKTKKEAKIKEIKAFKGFDKTLTCINKQYVIGENYTHSGKIKLCQ